MSALLGELAGLLLDCGSHSAGELPGYIRSQALPQLSVTPALQVAHCWLLWCDIPDIWCRGTALPVFPRVATVFWLHRG